MLRTNVLMTAPVMAFLMCGTAQAALTVDQVWADLQAAAVSGGMKITVATEVPGDRELTLNGVTIAPEGEPAIATISEVSIVEQEDGSVAFFPGEIKLQITGPANVVINHEELSVSAFEDAGGLGYGIDADSLNVLVNVVDGDSTFDGNFNLISVGGRYTRGLDALGMEMSADQLVYDIKQKDPALGIDGAQISDTADLVMTGELTLPEGIDLMSLQNSAAFAEAVRAGLGVSLEMTQGISKGEMTDNNPMLPMSMVFTAEPGVTSVTMNADEFAVATSVEGMELNLRPPMVPAPVNASTGAFVLGLGMPVVTGEEAGEYGFELKLENLVLDEAAWGMIDPTAVLERGPLDLALDLGGEAKIDMLDLIMAGEADTAPAVMPELQTLDIRALSLKALGAVATGTGAFTFDNSMVAMGGPPLPVGTADVRLEGGNKVIDAMIKLGVITEEDAMGARMMMAMFGKPEGDDVLTSKIEAREGGSIFVNGQQIQ
ncbi:hypothetical protein [Pseudotabrizicola alkalilacus]|uniref:DUF2125 domain-containing protein n=1 Tax=Pseudotabrizicola alkalilacus TaxID=2305252 RepID=A0A411Z5I4_9RHOB|nr:hypothetical protein [Pseudotabrizicola alkalilacus]RGP38323.1 hypothetical protein D1012_05730 [Pseudotabrizicola alkalilacus]